MSLEGHMRNHFTIFAPGKIGFGIFPGAKGTFLENFGEILALFYCTEN